MQSGNRYVDPAPRTDSSETYPPFSNWIVLASMIRFTLSVLEDLAFRIWLLHDDDAAESEASAGVVVDDSSVATKSDERKIVEEADCVGRASSWSNHDRAID